MEPRGRNHFKGRTGHGAGRRIPRGVYLANHLTSEIAQAFGVHPNLVAGWTKHALELLPELFTPQQSGPGGQASSGSGEGELSKKSSAARWRTSGDGSIQDIGN